ncbi:hypothetical protein Tco_0975996 [Tanacetum coccineum]|uniref:Uncharacterized protein n=1 Tax=Tanacetum coccineum TaxID=301880 RepID=A0ABQ5EFZ7_9ASTR
MMLAKALSRKKHQFVNNNGLKEELDATMVFMAKIKNVLSDSDESSLSVNDTDEEVPYYSFISKSENDDANTLYYYDKSEFNYCLLADNNDDKEIFHDKVEFDHDNVADNLFDSKHDHNNLQSDDNKLLSDHNKSKGKHHVTNHGIVKFMKK